MSVKRGASKWNAGDQLMAADLNDTLDAVSAFELVKFVNNTYTIDPDAEHLIVLQTGALPTLPSPALHTGKTVTVVNSTGATINLIGNIWVPHVGAVINPSVIWPSSIGNQNGSKFVSDGTYWIMFH